MTPALKIAHEKVKAEEARLLAERSRIEKELAQVRSVLRMMHGTVRAPAGTLPAKVLDVLDRQRAMSNSEIRAAIKRTGYPYSLLPIHVTKTLIALLSKRRVVRHGEGAAAKYTLRD